MRKSIRAALTTELLDLCGRGVQALMFKELSSHPSNDLTAVRIRQYWDENSVLRITSIPALLYHRDPVVQSKECMTGIQKVLNYRLLRQSEC